MHTAVGADTGYICIIGVKTESLGTEGQHIGGDSELDVCRLSEDTRHIYILLVPDDMSPSNVAWNLPIMECGGGVLYRWLGSANSDGTTQFVRCGQTERSQYESTTSEGTENQINDGHP